MECRLKGCMFKSSQNFTFISSFYVNLKDVGSNPGKSTYINKEQGINNKFPAQKRTVNHHLVEIVFFF